ncbi:MAG: DUF362 domain-containing protein [Candidatus Woesearchaeota archaeon]
MQKRVSIVKCESYNECEAAIDRSVRLIGGWKRFVKKNDQVLIKPNMLVGKGPEHAVTTHPAMIEAIIKKVQEQGAEVIVGDSSASRNFSQVADKTQLGQMCKRLGVRLIELEKPVWIDSNGTLVKKFPISNTVMKADLVINVPKLKTHIFTAYTGAVKNLFGTLPGHLKSHFHLKYMDKTKFSEMLLELYMTINPGLTIMDAVIGMEGAGPGQGKPKYLGMVIAGDDALAVDQEAARIVGLEKAPMFEVAKERGLVATYEVTGDKVARQMIEPADGVISSLRHRLFDIRAGLTRRITKPVVGDECTGCEECKRICPVHAINVKKKAEIDYSKCIKCFCCYEVCSYDAIKLQRFK